MKKNLFIIISLLIIETTIGIHLFVYYKIPNSIDVKVHSKPENNYMVDAGITKIQLKNKSKTIKTNMLGSFDSIFDYKFLLLNLSKEIKINIVDKEPPEYIEFDDKVEVYLDEKYDESKYKCKVKDNYDKTEDIKISTKGNVDTSKTGTYYLEYTATDKSGNQSKKVRKVTIEKKSPLSLNVSEFNLTDYFQDILLPETGDMGNDYMDSLYFAGDSVYWNFTKYGLYDSSKVWAKPCTDPVNIYTQQVEVNNRQSQYTIPELIANNKPKYVILNIGGCQSQYSSVEDFINPYKSFLKDMQEHHKETKIIVQTFNPVIEKQQTPYINNEGRNKFNYYIAEMCRELNIPLLDASNILKDQNGSCRANLCMDDGYHPNVTGMNMMLDYVRTHGYKER